MANLYIALTKGKHIYNEIIYYSEDWRRKRERERKETIFLCLYNLSGSPFSWWSGEGTSGPGTKLDN